MAAALLPCTKELHHHKFITECRKLTDFVLLCNYLRSEI